MRHRMAGRKLNRTSGHRIALLRNLAAALIEHKTIKTTVPKAKELRRFVEKLVTMARTETLANRRLLISRLGNKPELTQTLIDLATTHFKSRPGGYVRIVKAGYRYGDNAPMAIVQFVGFEPVVSSEITLSETAA
jgi:large subunit ribosomal protein L17